MAAKKKSTDGKRKSARKQPAKKTAKQKAVKKPTTGDETTKRKSSKKQTPVVRKTTRQRTTVSPAAEKHLFPVVGLGASAGGLEALEEFFRHLPANSGMAFIVVMHQAAKHVSLLPELLDKCTEMDVTAITDRMTIQPNHVYIVPPGKNVDVLSGTLHLSDLPAKHAAPLPIDHFFRSLAAERREKAVAIVLSGTGTDGTVGLSAIKGESGMVMVQSVESAKFSGMPQNAINAGWADYVLPPADMPKPLIAYAQGPFLKAPPSPRTPTPAIEKALPEILLQLRRRCGHDFSGYKYSTICRRIERRMNLHQIDDPKQYLKYLNQHKTEPETLFKELLIGVTSFFRDPWAFETLTSEALMPMLQAKAEDSQFRVWVPGCATGEEAYSVAILLRECMDELKIHLSVQIFATDLDADAIETARSGLFPSGIGTDVSVQRLGQFFTKQDGGYRIRKELRDWLVFAPHNVIHDPPFTKLDLISCRNLLIYMQADLQKKLLTLFHYSLHAGGCMFLGTSESISDFNDLFETLSNKAKLFRRKDAVARPERSVRFPVVGRKSETNKERPIEAQSTAAPVRDSIAQMLAADFAPPTVVVNEQGEIVHVHGRTGKFLELASGGPPKSVVGMAREGLELDLSAAIRTAMRQTLPVIHENVAVKTNGDTTMINLVVQKISEPSSLLGLLRISFVTVAEVSPPEIEMSSAPADQGAPAKSSGRVQALTPREKELQQELQHSNESLQRTVEELDASNEEMKSTNEELQSTNEELQSTNEEMETSKEELQSLNEELQTVNAEFQEKIRELSMANDDMSNLLNSTDIATIFLDNSLNIKRYTKQAQRIVRVIPTDVGRSLRDLTSHLQHDQLVKDAEQVLKTLIPQQREVQTEDGEWLLMRIMPYRTAEDRIDGLVITFVDVNALRLAQQGHQLRESLIDAVPLLISCIDQDGKYLFVNAAYEQLLGKSKDQILGMHYYQVLGDDAGNVCTPYFEAALCGKPQKFEIEIKRLDGSSDPLLMQAIPRQDEHDQVSSVYVIGTDMTSIKLAETGRVLSERILHADNKPLLMLDSQLRVRLANAPFYEMFQVSPAGTEGRLIYELGNNQWDIASLRQLLEEILPKDCTFTDFEVVHDFPDIGTKRMSLDASRITTGDGEPDLILLAIKDISA